MCVCVCVCVCKRGLDFSDIAYIFSISFKKYIIDNRILIFIYTARDDDNKKLNPGHFSSNCL